MMLRSRLPRRRGFTLLEVLLASAIATVLLGALYMAFDLVLRQADAGRDVVARGDLARGVVNRMSIDLAGCLGPLPPKSGGGVPDEAAATTTTTPAATTTPAVTTGATAADVADAAAPTETQAAADVSFQGGLYGSATQVTLFVSRVPPGLTSRETVAASGSTQAQLPADLFRVSYYLAAGGGLCRQVRPWVTADGVRNSTDPEAGTEAADLIAEEVTDVQFEFFDGSSWAGQWDGAELQTDGKTPKGPPRAIRMTLTIQLPGTTTAKQIQHVFPVRAAVGLYVPPVPADATTTGGS